VIAKFASAAAKVHGTSVTHYLGYSIQRAEVVRSSPVGCKRSEKAEAEIGDEASDNAFCWPFVRPLRSESSVLEGLTSAEMGIE
jgi:hypothetical protein